MTAEPDMLPKLVDEGLDFFNLAGDEGDKLYVRAIRQHIAAQAAEIEALRAEVERLRALAWCAYQMAGMHDAPLVWLDRLSEAANGDVLPDADTLMDELLPYQPDVVCEAEARAERLAEAVRGWWEMHRPVGWTEDQHRAFPHVNLATDAEKALATALLRDQEEGR